MTARQIEITRLRRERPRSRLVRASLAVLFLLVAASWVEVGLNSPGLLTGSRAENASRFFSGLRPYPLRDRDFDFGIAAKWAGDLLDSVGFEAVLRTLGISVAAVVLAWLAAAVLCLPATRTLATAEPFLPGSRPPGRWTRLGWRVLAATVRSFFVLVRALPEYAWAFLLIIFLGPTVWAAVLALALHNVGILGRLNAETIENLPPDAPSALRALGAGRLQIAGSVAYPTLLPRFLLYFFYRWETCVRAATVIGMLGVVSLGYWVEEARAANHYDEMFFLILLGAVLVIAGDLLSALARRAIRRAS